MGSIIPLDLRIRWRGWTLQTNALGLAGSLAWGDIPETISVTSTNLPMDPANRAVFFRLRSP